MGKKRATAAERKYIEAAVGLGCAICGGPAQYHHCRGLEFGCGMGLRAPHDCGFGLCDRHHDELHDILGKRVWEAKYGTQKELWEKTRRRVGALTIGW